MSADASLTAAVLVIGDEILSGRTKDKNIGFLADYLERLGIDLREARIVPDVEGEIIDAVDALRKRYTYVFTTGGIGPTHDDITADAVAKAFGVELYEDERIIARMLERLKPEDLNAARRRMARVPRGASLVDNPLTKVPGFRIENVIVMAGVPSIMQAMMDNVAPTLGVGVRVIVETLEAGVPEGAYAAALGEVAAACPALSIGSYPSLSNGRFQNQIVVRGRERELVDAAKLKIEDMLRTLKAAAG
jgi:molybdenum cofactor synthesis domain-containing protein